MDLTSIIAEADVRIPNAFSNAQKVSWLNEINNEFFDVVKIPKSATFFTAANGPSYVLAADVRAKNIDFVRVGNSKYMNFLYGDVPPGQNYQSFDDSTSTLTLNPAPSIAGVTGIVKYFRVATTTFISSNLAATPSDVPTEYHWIFILGLCERIAKAMDDAAKANNYATDYRGNLLIAQQNYQRG